MPRVPETAPAAALRLARDVLAAFGRQFGQLVDGGAAPGATVGLDLAGLAPDVLAVIDDMLGEGEVAIRIDAPHRFRIQESVFPGLWRVCGLDGEGRLAADWLEAAPMPSVVAAAARASARPAVAPVDPPAGAMNSPALLAELASSVAGRSEGDAAHVVNLTLLPLSPEDRQLLDAALPAGPVAILSRGFGSCRITSTGVRDVWRVQYFNSMSTPILDTIEVVDVPEVALAAPEDLADSRERLTELVDWMGASLEEAETPRTGDADGARAAGADPRADAATRLECRICWHVYDPAEGDPVWQVPAGTPFAELPPHWTCPGCAATKDDFLVLRDG
jgi:hydrogenase-1 operon protein HyaF